MSTLTHSPATRSTSALIEASTLAQQLNNPRLCLLDASYFMPSEEQDVQEAFEAAHLPGAQRFDLSVIADPNSELPHMLPSEVQFEQHMSQLGLTPDSWVVVYDAKGLGSAPRAWWMLRVFGHGVVGQGHVQVLNGGVPRWKQLGLPLESGPASPFKASSGYQAQLQPSLLWQRQQVEQHLQSPQHVLLDARPEARFSGEVPEPRATQCQGHIEGSINWPWKAVMDPETYCLKPKAELETAIAQLDPSGLKQYAATCGSGVTACTLALALYELGFEEVPVYDGSWAEWGNL